MLEEIEYPPFKFKIVGISRNALVTIKPTHPVHRPGFLDSAPARRRYLMSYDQIDVQRDLIDFIFILNSEEDVQDIKYTLMLEDWQEDQIKV